MSKKPSWVIGRHAVSAVLATQPERALELWYVNNKRNPHLAEVLDTAQQAGVACRAMEKSAISNKVASDNHQGLALMAQPRIEGNQEQLLKDDAFIPLRPANDPKDLARSASRMMATSTGSGAVEFLIDGVSRDENNEVHHWASQNLPAEVILEWDNPVSISTVLIKCDTNLKRNIMMLKYYREDEAYTHSVPRELLKSVALDIMVNDKWSEVGTVEKNRKRLIKFCFPKSKTSAIRIRMTETYGSEIVKLFELRCYEA